MSAIPLDGLQLKVLSEALAERLLGRRLEAASMPDRYTVTLTVGRADLALLLSIDPRANQVALVPAPDRREAGLRHPFRELLSAHLAGGTVQRIHTPLGERQLVIDVRRRNRIGDATDVQLVAELFGSRADLVLVEAGEVTDSLRRLRHQPHDPFRPLAAAVQADQPGLGGPPLALKEYRHLANTDPTFAAAFWQSAWSEPGRYRPVAMAGLSPSFYPLALSHRGPPQPPLGDLLAAVSAEVLIERQRARLEAARSHRLAELDRTLLHLERQVEDLTAAQEAASGAATLRRRAEALLAVMTQLAPAATEFTYTDWTDGLERTVPLEPTLSLSGTAEAWFKEARRITARAQRALRLLPAAESKLASVRLERQSVAAATALPDLPPPSTKRGSRAKAAAARPYHSLRTPAGHQLRVGRNQAGNDLLLRLARPDDLWLHAHGISGSHVILSTQGGIGPADKQAAAALAAWFSKGRRARRVLVDCTARRHVRRPAKAAPGFVVFDHQETLDAPVNGPLLQFLLDQIEAGDQPATDRNRSQGLERP